MWQLNIYFIFYQVLYATEGENRKTEENPADIGSQQVEVLFVFTFKYICIVLTSEFEIVTCTQVRNLPLVDELQNYSLQTIPVRDNDLYTCSQISKKMLLAEGTIDCKNMYIIMY